MPTKIRIYITEEVLDKSCFCLEGDLSDNCAIALAIRDIFPAGQVFLGGFHDDGARLHVAGLSCSLPKNVICLPPEATSFIREFDSKLPHDRRQMEPISFEIEISDDILKRYFPIPGEVQSILSSSPTLELVEQP